MKHVLTQDGSITFHNQIYDDHYHSKSGAIEEAFLKYIRPAKIAGRKEVKILDIGFGLGYNVAAALDEFFLEKKSKNDLEGAKIEIISLEKDREVLEEMQKLNIDKNQLKHFDIVKLAAKNLHYEDDKIKIRIIFGDAKETIKKLNENYFDAVFQDGFSPLKNPELWSADFFKAVYLVMKKDAIMTTYSFARHVRDNMQAAGFSVSKGPEVGRRGPSTVAEKK